MNYHFKALILASGLSQAKVADRIAMKVGEFCTERQIRSWIADPASKNGRPCPQFAIDAMAEFESRLQPIAA